MFKQLLPIVLFALACTGQAPSTPVAPQRTPVHIGFAGPLTGKQAEYGEMVLDGATLRMEEAVQDTRLAKFDLSLVRGDDQATASNAVSVAQVFASDALMPVVVGHFNSSCTLAAQPTYTQASLPNISYGSTNDEVGAKSPWTFRTPYKNMLQGATLARYAASKGYHRVGIIFENEDYGKGLKENFETSAKELGIEIVAQTSYDKNVLDYGPLVLTVNAAAPDAILLSGFYPELSVVAKVVREFNPTVPLLAGDGVGSSMEYITSAKAAAEGTVATGPFLAEQDRPEIDAFRQRFATRFGRQPDSWAVYAYDAVGLALGAIAEVGPDRAAIRDALEKHASPDTAFPGLVGPIWFDGNRDAVNDAVNLAVVDGGKYKVISR